MTANVRIRPGGPATVVAAAGVAVLALIVGLLVAYLFASEPSVAWTALIPLVPSLLMMAFVLSLMLRAASGLAVDAAGIRCAVRHPARLTWTEIAGLRWGRTRWWGRRNHQLVADLRDGQIVVVWGVRNAIQHERIVKGLIEATEVGLIPPTVARAHDLYQAWPVVAGDLDRTAALLPR
ncbi:MAG: hypothetical protein M3140_05445 [Actinomycetota bacterium]|nr:hypothetical protein [Actinomycetota bacterium]